MVYSSGTKVKRDFTSNDTVLKYRGIFSFLVLIVLLTRSGYTVNSMKDFIVKTKNRKIPQNFNMVSFDAKSLFTFVPLEYTIHIITKQIFEDHKITH